MINSHFKGSWLLGIPSFLFLITFGLEAFALPRFIVDRGVTCFLLAQLKGCWDTDPANDPAVAGKVCYKDKKIGKVLTVKDTSVPTLVE